MKKSILVLVVIIIAVVVGVVFFGKKNETPLVGGDRDEHGCLGSAGYAFDEEVGACIRAFEMTPDIKDAAELAVAHVGESYALTVASFNSYEERGAYDIMLERGVERTSLTVVIKNGKVQSPSIDTIQAVQLLSQKLALDADTLIATIDAVAGDFAKGQVRFTEESGGGIWFGANTEKGWEIAYSGNGIIPCAIADQYDFPKDMVLQCIADEAPRDVILR
ncbi:MAG TPA: hypothetical protein VJH94_04640 [Candidatus Paceibacterota bacterium]